jgi:hypothetical protein
MVDTSQGSIQELEDFQKSPKGIHDRWDTEMQAGFDAQKKWHKQGDATVDRFLDKRKASEEQWFRLNLFYSNITTLRAMLFGKLPEITFDRANFDYNDDPARVASIILTRCLQSDIGTPNDEYSDSLRMNLDDRLMPGLGLSRVRYEFQKSSEEVAAVYDMDGNLQVEGYEKEVIDWEKAPIEYVHWRDCNWSPCRTWAELRWFGFKTYPTRDQLITRFGEDLGKKIPLTQTQKGAEEKVEDDPNKDAWSRAEIWEIWSRDDKKVYWWCKDFGQILDVKGDPLKMAGFFPIPKPMAANLTTSSYMPLPDYIQAQDLYNEIDKLETRITTITEAVKVVGVYDKSQHDVERVFTEGVENDLIAVDNWAMWAEKGGMQGVIEWFPYETIAGVLKELIGRRNDVKSQLFEITGMSDIMRGAQAAGGSVTATERSLEARFASVRVQALQDEFANYATDLIRLRAEIISKHFSPETIFKQSNIAFTVDGQDPELVRAAIDLIKTREDLVWRVSVKPESVSMVDYAQLKQERTEYITALATYFQSMGPMLDKKPELEPLLLQLLQWGLAGFKGSAEIEGVVDAAVEQASKQEEQGQDPDPDQIKAMDAQAQRQHEEKMEMMRFQNDAKLTQIKMMADNEEITHEVDERIREVQANTEQGIIHETVQRDANMTEESHETDEFIIRERERAQIQMRNNDA